MTIYLDCNATTPLAPEVREAVLHWFNNEIGNAGSRTHQFGHKAKSAVSRAREQVASVVECSGDEVLFTSGATESNNIALLGLQEFGEQNGLRHIISTGIEHNSVLEPLKVLSQRGFDVNLVGARRDGLADIDAIRRAIRKDTLCVSVMHVNNETGVEQPLAEVAQLLEGHEAFLHVDASQGFGKVIKTLRNRRIDLISVSSHKIYGPVGVGALIIRKRGHVRTPLKPVIFGGGQEKGLRPGTVPVPLVVGLGVAAEVALREHEKRRRACLAQKEAARAALQHLNIQEHGDTARILPHVLNFSVPGIDCEALMVALKGIVAVSNGSACTSNSYKPSHVLKLMGLSEDECGGAVRFSWCHMTPTVDWKAVAKCIEAIA